MSQENVELVHRAYDAMGRQDLDAFLALHDPECVIAPRIVSVEGRDAYRGHDGLRAFWTDINASFAEWSPQIEESRDFNDKAIVRYRFRGRGRDSAVTIDEPAWLAVKFRAGRISWWAAYASEVEALDAAGLKEVMSQEIVEIVGRIYAAWERGDFSWVGWADRDIEYVIVEGPAPGSWRGLGGLEEGGLGILNAWKGLRVEAEECRQLDDDRVLVLTRLSGRGKTSGIELGQMRAQGADVLQIRGGKVTRFLLYWDRERALADLGLKE